VLLLLLLLHLAYHRHCRKGQEAGSNHSCQQMQACRSCTAVGADPTFNMAESLHLVLPL
jgi:hypothetical protein